VHIFTDLDRLRELVSVPLWRSSNIIRGFYCPNAALAIQNVQARGHFDGIAVIK
jgi:hypothetical protein